VKNNYIFKISIIALAVLNSTANAGFANNSIPNEMKLPIVKFLLAMGGIVFFSIIIFVGLSIYNRFFVSKYLKNIELSKKSLQTPTDKDSAVLSYLKMNELK